MSFSTVWEAFFEHIKGAFSFFVSFSSKVFHGSVHESLFCGGAVTRTKEEYRLRVPRLTLFVSFKVLSFFLREPLVLGRCGLLVLLPLSLSFFLLFFYFPL